MSLAKKNYRTLLCLLSVALFFSGCNGSVFESEIPYLIGVNNVLIESSKSNEEWGGFQGEGYSIETYKLNEEAVKTFKEKKVKALPLKKGNETWNRFGWNENSFDTSYNEVLLVALAYGGKKTIEEQSIFIKSLLNRQGVYYAFHYKPDKENPRYVQFFVFDTNTAILYIIESNV